MTSEKHLILIVEDESDTAEELAKIVRKLDCEPVKITNRADALTAITEHQFCLIVLDLNIRWTDENMTGDVKAGRELLREIRARYNGHTGRGYRLPVLVVSGNTRDVETAGDVTDDGADRVIRKIFTATEVSDHVRRLFERSGRDTHEMCSETFARPRLAQGERLLLSIPADSLPRGSKVLLGTTTIPLTKRMLLALLELVAAKLAEPATGRAHKSDLGKSDQSGSKVAFDLNKELRPATGDTLKIIANDHKGNYWLTDDVEIGAIAFDRLLELGDEDITDVAERIRDLVKAKPTPAAPEL